MLQSNKASIIHAMQFPDLQRQSSNFQISIAVLFYLIYAKLEHPPSQQTQYKQPLRLL
jgi:hypothetical protein